MLFFDDPSVWLRDLFIRNGLGYSISMVLSTVTLVLIVICLSWITNLIAKSVILKIVTRIVRRTASTWDDIFLEQKVFTRLSHLAPAWVIWSMAGWALKAYPLWMLAVHRLAYVYMVLVGTVVISSFIEAWHKIYNTLPISQHRHIKGYVQLVKIVVYLIAILIIISVVFRKDISVILTGIGAMAAVLILVFKDTLLGLVASIQLSANEMLHIGDWITIPGRTVDGLVTDITLNTVKIQNFDKTIITVPTYALVNESFQNWKGMEDAGIRQIKRSVNIDMTTICFPDKALQERISAFTAVRTHIESRGADSKLTNLGLFRIYTEDYLRNNPAIDESQTIVVRHRQTDGNGLPLEVLAYSKFNQFISYENLQSELFEHLIATMQEFGLKVFQQPTGHDFVSFTDRK